MKTKFYKSILCSILITAASTSVNAQGGYQCGTDQHLQTMIAEHPEIGQAQIDYENWLQQQILIESQDKSISPLHIIPLVFHVIHIDGGENISDNQIYDAVNILNRDWAKQNADTVLITKNTPFRDSLSSAMNFQFRLATIDPDGNCTNGIDRIYSHFTINADDNSKLNQWPRENYFNIWVIKTFKPNPSGFQAAAYALFPAATAGYPQGDGVISLSQYVGSIGSSSPFNSRTLTHECGHSWNLQHPWGGNNDAATACGDDGVDDTPLTKGHLTCDSVPACTMVPAHGSGHHAFVYNFDNVALSSGTMDTTNVTDTLMTLGHFNAHNVSSSPVDSLRFGYSNWGGGSVNGDTLASAMTGNIDTSKYYEVSIKPNYGYATNLTGITFNVKRNGSGVRSFAVRSSLNNYATNLKPSISPANVNLYADTVGAANRFFYVNDTNTSQNGCKITLSGAGYAYVYSPITFRIYAWNAEDSLGSFSIDNFTFTNTFGGVIENFRNYMDYSYCDVMFTKGQKVRTRIAGESSIAYRNHLYLNSNLVATGTDSAHLASPPLCVPKPDFYAMNAAGVIVNDVCEGGTLTFHTNITNITKGTAYTKRWHFDGATVPFVTTSVTASTSGTQTATQNATYPVGSSGERTVTLTIINAAGTDSLMQTAFIHVSPNWAQYNGLASEGFENTTPYYYWNWEIYNPDHNYNGWEMNNYAAYTGSHSMRMNNDYSQYVNYHDDVDYFITPKFNLTYLTGGQFTFRCAGASRALVLSDDTDQLKIYSSADCGATWTVRKTISGATLNNNGYLATSFTPVSQSQWSLQSFNIPTALAVGNVRFKFEYTSGFANNNIWIDDINIMGTVGIEENQLTEGNVSIYPNPTNNSSTIYYHLNKKGNVKIEVVNVIGQTIMSMNNQNQPEGDYQYEVSKVENNMTDGIYFVKFTLDGSSITKKLVITK